MTNAESMVNMTKEDRANCVGMWVEVLNDHDRLGVITGSSPHIADVFLPDIEEHMPMQWKDLKLRADYPNAWTNQGFPLTPTNAQVVTGQWVQTAIERNNQLAQVDELQSIHEQIKASENKLQRLMQETSAQSDDTPEWVTKAMERTRSLLLIDDAQSTREKTMHEFLQDLKGNPVKAVHPKEHLTAEEQLQNIINDLKEVVARYDK